MRLDCHHLYRLWDLLITAIMAFVAIEVPTHFVLEYDIFAQPSGLLAHHTRAVR